MTLQFQSKLKSLIRFVPRAILLPVATAAVVVDGAESLRRLNEWKRAHRDRYKGWHRLHYYRKLYPESWDYAAIGTIDDDRAFPNDWLPAVAPTVTCKSAAARYSVDLAYFDLHEREDVQVTDVRHYYHKNTSSKRVAPSIPEEAAPTAKTSVIWSLRSGEMSRDEEEAA